MYPHRSVLRSLLSCALGMPFESNLAIPHDSVRICRKPCRSSPRDTGELVEIGEANASARPASVSQLEGMAGCAPALDSFARHRCGDGSELHAMVTRRARHSHDWCKLGSGALVCLVLTARPTHAVRTIGLHKPRGDRFDFRFSGWCRCLSDDRRTVDKLFDGVNERCRRRPVLS